MKDANVVYQALSTYMSCHALHPHISYWLCKCHILHRILTEIISFELRKIHKILLSLTNSTCLLNRLLCKCIRFKYLLKIFKLKKKRKKRKTFRTIISHISKHFYMLRRKKKKILLYMYKLRYDDAYKFSSQTYELC